MGWYIGAKDKIDRALVRQYANTQTCNFDTERIPANDVLNMINMLSMSAKNFHFK